MRRRLWNREGQDAPLVSPSLALGAGGARGEALAGVRAGWGAVSFQAEKSVRQVLRPFGDCPGPLLPHRIPQATVNCIVSLVRATSVKRRACTLARADDAQGCSVVVRKDRGPGGVPAAPVQRWKERLRSASLPRGGNPCRSDRQGHIHLPAGDRNSKLPMASLRSPCCAALGQ
jgi:hypothetical protein